MAARTVSPRLRARTRRARRLPPHSEAQTQLLTDALVSKPALIEPPVLDAEARESYRVPVPTASLIDCRFSIGPAAMRAQAINVSQGGALLKLASPPRWLDLFNAMDRAERRPPKVMLRLDYQAAQAELECSIVRISGNIVALEFIQPAGSHRTSRTLRRMLSRLEAALLRARHELSEQRVSGGEVASVSSPA